MVLFKRVFIRWQILASEILLVLDWQNIASDWVFIQ